MNELTVILIGSNSDLPHAKKISSALQGFGLKSLVQVASAHKATSFVLQFVRRLDSSEKKIVYVAIAGRSNALGGVIEGNSLNPVINCPPISEKFAGLDLLSSLRMPSGMGSVTVLEAENCAVACAKIFAHNNASIRKKLAVYKKSMGKKASGK